MLAAWLIVLLAGCWVVFPYVGYPLLLYGISRGRRTHDPHGAVDLPTLSVVIAVHNGEGRLAAKLEETLALPYPRPFEVIVASDCSIDRTDAIAASFAARGARLVRNDARQGKEAAQALAIATARGDVVVFTDVSARLGPGALVEIARPFLDTGVGCVSSEDDVTSDSGGEGLYVRIEMAVRRWESEVGCLVGLSGSFFAVRRPLCTPWNPNLAGDFRVALEAARRGFRAVSAPLATAKFSGSPSLSADWRRRIRTFRRGIAVLSAYRDLLAPRHGRVALALWGHKATRFTAPFAAGAGLVATALLTPRSDLAAALLAIELVAIGSGVAALAVPALGRLRVARLSGFFLMMNAAAAVAWFHHLSGRTAVIWEPTNRAA